MTLVDRTNHHLFQPLLYQVATAGLSPAEIAYPIRRILRRQQNARVLLAEALAILPAEKRVRLGDGAVPYDHLILAAGAAHSYFGKDEWQRHAPGLKTLEDALEIRRRVLLAFEEAEREEDPEVRRQWLTFVVVGGGPTGVEMAGAFAEIARHTLPGDFRRIDPRSARVLLLEAGPRVLSSFPEELSEKASSSSRRSASRSGRARRSPRSTSRGETGGDASPRAPSCGRRGRGSPSRGRSGRRSTGPGACSCSPT